MTTTDRWSTNKYQLNISYYFFPRRFERAMYAFLTSKNGPDKELLIRQSVRGSENLKWISRWYHCFFSRGFASRELFFRINYGKLESRARGLVRFQISTKLNWISFWVGALPCLNPTCVHVLWPMFWLCSMLSTNSGLLRLIYSGKDLMFSGLKIGKKRFLWTNHQWKS